LHPVRGAGNAFLLQKSIESGQQVKICRLHGMQLYAAEDALESMTARP
jgi:hypothetical protein